MPLKPLQGGSQGERIIHRMMPSTVVLIVEMSESGDGQQVAP